MNIRWFKRREETIIWSGLSSRGKILSNECHLKGIIRTGMRANHLEIWIAADGDPLVLVISFVFNHRAKAKAFRISKALGIRNIE